MKCGAVTLTGAAALVLVCQRSQGHEGQHRCLLPYPGANTVRTWSDR